MTDKQNRLASSLRPAVVAIDGPAASGKSTIGQQLAAQLGYLFFDTGVMYRAVTWAALDRELDVTDEDAMGDLAEQIVLDIAPPSEADSDGRLSTVLVDGADITAYIRTAEVDRAVSPVSVHARVRTELTRQQRRIGLEYGSGKGDRTGVVMVGRDIGTVVLPEAPVKVYLDATPKERARRRYSELRVKGVDVDYNTILSQIIRRDEIDSSRALAPLQVADDAQVIDTTGLTPAQVIDKILNLIQVAATLQ